MSVGMIHLTWSDFSCLALLMTYLATIFVVDSSIGEVMNVEICGLEPLELSCPQNSTVVYIQQAFYGRMAPTGRCVTDKLGTEGRCSGKVRLYVERECAGRKWCSVPEPNQYLSAICSRSAPKYLEVSYMCVNVFNPLDSSCTNEPLKEPIASTSFGYLASVVTEDTNKGSQNCPWSFELKSNQTISLTLLDFGFWQPTTKQPAPDKEHNICTIYALIHDGQLLARNAGTVVCRGTTRESMVLSKSGGNINVTIAKLRKTENPSYFRIRYKVVDCPSFQPPPGVEVIDMKSFGYTVRCTNHNATSWVIQCGPYGQWTPLIHSNCSGIVDVSSTSSKETGNQIIIAASKASDESMHSDQGLSWAILSVVLVGFTMVGIILTVHGFYIASLKNNTRTHDIQPNDVTLASEYLECAHSTELNPHAIRGHTPGFVDITRYIRDEEEPEGHYNEILD